MASLEDLGLRASGLNDMVLFWRYGDERRAVITDGYDTTRSYLDWLLVRSGNGSHARNIPANLRVLDEPASVLAVSLGQHCLGLMRPMIFGEVEAMPHGELPFLIALEPEGHFRNIPDYPILTSARGDAVGLVRRIQLATGINTRRWRDYKCERWRGTLERLVINLRDGRAPDTFRTELEREFFYALHPTRTKRRRAA